MKSRTHLLQLSRGPVLLGLLTVAGVPSIATAQTVYRCPGPPVLYTIDLTPAEAAARQCRLPDGSLVQAPTPPAAPFQPRRKPEIQKPTPSRSTGSALAVSRDGLLLTNHHVVKGCDSIRVSQPGAKPEQATSAQSNAEVDLAILKVGANLPASAIFRDSPVRSGEQVVALGFPYSGLLATEVNVSNGIVSATAGLRNDSSRLQIQAPVQPGSSGGPLVDSSGAVVGVVVSKLNAMAVAKVTGDIPQNISFAIKGEVAMRFLDEYKIAYVRARSNGAARSMADVVESSKRWVYLVECTSAR